MAAGTSSRFVPLSAEVPKGLLEVKGEILVEREIRQLREAGVDDITVVTGYKAHLFDPLKEKFGIRLVHNPDYQQFNNVSSLMRVLDRLDNTFICSSDNYFPDNVFIPQSDDSYYSALFASGATNEYCVECDEDDNIQNVVIGGRDAWYMVGHVFFSSEFSRRFKQMLEADYLLPSTRQEYWEDVYIRHLKELPRMKIRRYGAHDIEEFDTLDELRRFDSSYINDTRSTILKQIAARLGCAESVLHGFKNIPREDGIPRFSFQAGDAGFIYDGLTNSINRQ